MRGQSFTGGGEGRALNRSAREKGGERGGATTATHVGRGICICSLHMHAENLQLICKRYNSAQKKSHNHTHTSLPPLTHTPLTHTYIEGAYGRV